MAAPAAEPSALEDLELSFAALKPCGSLRWLPAGDLGSDQFPPGGFPAPGLPPPLPASGLPVSFPFCSPLPRDCACASDVDRINDAIAVKQIDFLVMAKFRKIGTNMGEG